MCITFKNKFCVDIWPGFINFIKLHMKLNNNKFATIYAAFDFSIHNRN